MVDAMIPVYYYHPGNTAEDNRKTFSQLFISVKLQQASNESDLAFISREHPSINCTDAKLPWIAILVDYGVTRSKVTATFTSGRKTERQFVNALEVRADDNCLRIYVAGATSKTFEFMKGEDFFEGLFTFEQPPEECVPAVAGLLEHMQYASTGNASNMNWEMGQENSSN